jgi:phosphomannomutase
VAAARVNTQDVLVARAEARDQAGLDRLMGMINDQLTQSGIAPVLSAGH